MDSKHTPGPWKWVEGSDQVISQTGGGLGDQEGIVAHVNPYMPAGVGRELLGTNNARLIAAAPDLLSTLKAMVSIAETDQWDEAMTGRQIIINDARTAIGKAEGM